MRTGLGTLKKRGDPRLIEAGLHPCRPPLPLLSRVEVASRVQDDGFLPELASKRQVTGAASDQKRKRAHRPPPIQLLEIEI